MNPGMELKHDILKLQSKENKTGKYSLKGIDGLDGDDLHSLLLYCGLYEREGEISQPWKDKITHPQIAEVLVKYKMW